MGLEQEVAFLLALFAFGATSGLARLLAFGEHQSIGRTCGLFFVSGIFALSVVGYAYWDSLASVRGWVRPFCLAGLVGFFRKEIQVVVLSMGVEYIASKFQDFFSTSKAVGDDNSNDPPPDNNRS